MDSYVLQRKIKAAERERHAKEPNHLYTKSDSTRVLQEEPYCANSRAEHEFSYRIFSSCQPFVGYYHGFMCLCALHFIIYCGSAANRARLLAALAYSLRSHTNSGIRMPPKSKI